MNWFSFCLASCGTSVKPIPQVFHKCQLFCTAYPLSPLLARRKYAVTSLEKSGFLMPKGKSLLGFFAVINSHYFFFIQGTEHQSVSALWFLFLFLLGLSFLAHENFVLYKMKTFLLSDDGFKIKGASGFGVGVIQDYVVTDVY